MIPESSPDPLDAARNEVFRKLGGSIVLLQQLEHCLKTFVGHQMIQGSTPEDVEAFITKRRESVSKMPLGGVVSRFFEDPSKARKPSAEAGWVRASFQLHGANQVTRQNGLKALVAERNHLVHGLIDDYDLRTAEGIALLNSKLNSLAARTRDELRQLREDLADLARGRQRLAEVFSDPEFMEYLVTQGPTNS